MAKYEVIRPWHGVVIGDIVELDKLHMALEPNVRLLKGEAGELSPATPEAVSNPSAEDAEQEDESPKPGRKKKEAE
ncbi:glycoprotein [Biostraticola tofi]|uniref:Glycoprotein n=1 Tax=Biostraticola tofi TaxID=466109 RepID=A0A4R3Z3J5_9GAMM|nr:glycoprotein [Biostraticola tofi]TCW00394.1 hypothetical protein EDC52_101744 [Biostraticola tofi]